MAFLFITGVFEQQFWILMKHFCLFFGVDMVCVLSKKSFPSFWKVCSHYFLYNFMFYIYLLLGIMAHTCSTQLLIWEAEAGASLEASRQPRLKDKSYFHLWCSLSWFCICSHSMGQSSFFCMWACQHYVMKKTVICSQVSLYSFTPLFCPIGHFVFVPVAHRHDYCKCILSSDITT